MSLLALLGPFAERNDWFAYSFIYYNNMVKSLPFDIYDAWKRNPFGKNLPCIGKTLLHSGNQWRNSHHQLHPRDDAGADEGPIPLLFLHSILADEQSNPSLLGMIQIDSLDHLGSPRPTKHHLDQQRYGHCFGRAGMVGVLNLTAMNPLHMDLKQVVWVSLLTVSVPSSQLNYLRKAVNNSLRIGRRSKISISSGDRSE